VLYLKQQLSQSRVGSRWRLAPTKSEGAIKMQLYAHAARAPYLLLTSTLTGLTSDARCSFCTLLVMVAENKNVCRSRGRAARMTSISFSKSSCRMRSASSLQTKCYNCALVQDDVPYMTKNFTLRREKPFMFSK
jgi:hypothetical protein